MLSETINRDTDETLFQMGVSLDYEVTISFADVRTKFLETWRRHRLLVFIDPILLTIWPEWNQYQMEMGNVTLIPVYVTEAEKNIETTLQVLNHMENNGLARRGDLVIAIGGGALMDVVSLAANLYRRGVKVIKVPTTLLGCVDASVGLKTGVNFQGRRNRLGTYYPNFEVVVDYRYLTSLPRSLVIEGLGEIYKIALIKSGTLFSLLEKHSDKIGDPKFYTTDIGQEIIRKAIFLMLEELHDNPSESILKRCVDFGHTFSPGVEMASLESTRHRSIAHGVAVSVDTLITSYIAHGRGLLSDAELKRIEALFDNIGFDAGHVLFTDVGLMWASLLEMTKHRGGKQNLPVPHGIGDFTFLQDVSFSDLNNAVAKLTLEESK